MEPLLRAFGASEAVLPQAGDYAFWMFVAALANLPAQSMNCAARAESSVKSHPSLLWQVLLLMWCWTLFYV